MEAKKIMDDLQKYEAQDEPQVIAQIHINHISAAEMYLQDYNHCCLCGHELEFTHLANFISGDVQEEAHCPSCNIRTKAEHHIMQ